MSNRQITSDPPWLSCETFKMFMGRYFENAENIRRGSYKLSEVRENKSKGLSTRRQFFSSTPTQHLFFELEKLYFYTLFVYGFWGVLQSNACKWITYILRLFFLSVRYLISTLNILQHNHITTRLLAHERNIYLIKWTSLLSESIHIVCRKGCVYTGYLQRKMKYFSGRSSIML